MKSTVSRAALCKRILPMAVALAAISGCTTVPITGRRQLSLVSDQQVLAASATQYRSFIDKSKLSGNTVQCDTVVRVGRRIASATERYLRDNGLGAELKNYSWEFNLVKSPEVNAFCMPGGKIVVYEGLMKLVDRDDELAVVLGHEVAHAVAKHSNERMSQQLLAQVGAGAVNAGASGQSAAVQAAAASAFGLGAQYGALLPFSRKHENEADYMGLCLMTLAGYNPDYAVGFWRKMSAQGSKVPEFLSSHPSDANRIRAIERDIPEVKRRFAPGAPAQK